MSDSVLGVTGRFATAPWRPIHLRYDLDLPPGRHRVRHRTARTTAGDRDETVGATAGDRDETTRATVGDREETVGAADRDSPTTIQDGGSVEADRQR